MTTITDIRGLVYRLALASYPLEGNQVVTLDAALTTLRGAIRSNSGGGAGKGGDPANRSLIDDGAFELYEDITGQIQTLYSGAYGYSPAGTPEENLIDWWTIYAIEDAAGNITDPMLDVAHSRLQSFLTRIERRLRPARNVEGLVACPHCGATHALNSNGEQTHALIATAPPSTVTLDDVTVTCGACGAQWEGETELTALGITIKTLNPDEPPKQPAKKHRYVSLDKQIDTAEQKLQALLADAERTRNTLRTATTHLIHLQGAYTTQDATLNELLTDRDRRLAPDRDKAIAAD